MNSREQAMLQAVNDAVDGLTDLIEHRYGWSDRDLRAIENMVSQLKDVQDLYRHQAGRYVQPEQVTRAALDEHTAGAALPGLGALVPGVGAGR
jgi:hypothetical protein